MVLNNLNQQFVIWFPPNWVYPEVEDVWMPVIRRMGLPYNTIEDFLNAQIQSLGLPGASMNNVTQQNGLMQVEKRAGFDIEHKMKKDITLTMKLSESYVTYFIMRQIMDFYYRIGEGAKELYLPSIRISLLDDAGYETISFNFYELTFNSLSDLSLTYASTIASNNTFTAGFHYNFLDVYYRDPMNPELLVSSNNPQKLQSLQF